MTKISKWELRTIYSQLDQLLSGSNFKFTDSIQEMEVALGKAIRLGQVYEFTHVLFIIISNWDVTYQLQAAAGYSSGFGGLGAMRHIKVSLQLADFDT